jgi:argininosuccinate lyase
MNILGIKVAGTLHTGRSRNDINATITRLKSRHIFLNLYSEIWNLRSKILQIAVGSLDIVMCEIHRHGFN